MVKIPDSNPLAPSIVLTALIKPTEKKRVMVKASQEKPRSQSTPGIPTLYGTKEGNNRNTTKSSRDLLSKRDLGERLLLRRSSNNPRKKQPNAPNQSGQYMPSGALILPPRYPLNNRNAIETSTPIATATPPSLDDWTSDIPCLSIESAA